MTNKIIIVLFSLLSFTLVPAQVLQKNQIREETLPEGQLVRVHVSGRNGDSAALLQRADGYWVYIKQTLYGPFDDVDLRNATPFVDSGNNWQFRASRGDRQILVVNGVQYGPFDQIWTPNFSKSGAHWGAVIKDAGRYAIVADGVKTRAFEWIFNETYNQPAPEVSGHALSSSPHFYGTRDRWLAIGANKENVESGQPAEFRFLSERGESAAFDQVQYFNASDPYDSFFYIEAYMTANSESFAFGVHQANLAPDEYYLWVDHVTYGPYRGALPNDYFGITRMAADGSNWIIDGTDKVYTRDKTFPYEGGFLSMAPNGRSFSFAFERDGQRYMNVNEREFGPYDDYQGAVFSPTGTNWLFSSRINGDYVQLVGPNATFGPFWGVQQVFFRGENWFSLAADEYDLGYVYANGAKILGPFDLMSTTSPNNKQNEAWNLVAFEGEQLSLIVNGEVRFRQARARPGILPSWNVSPDGAHYAMLVLNTDGTRTFIDNGAATSGLTVQNASIVPSESGDKNALLFTNQAKSHLLLSGQDYGPYTEAVNVVLSERGHTWAASAKDTDGEKLILPGGAPISCDQIGEIKSVRGEDAVVSNGFKDNRWSPRVNAVSLGTYNQAAINCSTDGSRTIFLATNEGDNLLKTFKVVIQP